MTNIQRYLSICSYLLWKNNFFIILFNLLLG